MLGGEKVIHRKKSLFYFACLLQIYSLARLNQEIMFQDIKV